MTPRGDAAFEAELSAAPLDGGAARSASSETASPAAAEPRVANFSRFLGPALLVSVGYMDPGNWATDLEAGTRFGYDLLWVLLVSNVMALLLQSLCARLGMVSGLDLASGCRREFSRPMSVALWILAELAIVACDLAEVLGSAVALQLLFGIPPLIGAVLTSVDVLLILLLQQRGMRWLEAVVLVLLLSIGGCMIVEVWLAQPPLSQIAGGLRPKLTGESLYVAIGILGATVMPHNLYLHSALVPRVAEKTRARSLRRNFWSTALALNLALLVNAAILIVSAAAFWNSGLGVHDLRDAHRLLAPILGSGLASFLFALGLLCAGQSATVSGTLAGQFVMEGFMQIRLHPVLRRLVTRGLAIIPAVAVLGIVGESGLMTLLVGSQIVLSLQLAFAVVPLIRLTNSRSLMGDYANDLRTKWLASACAALIVVANIAWLARLCRDLWQTEAYLAGLLATFAVASLLLIARVATVPLRSH